MNTFLNDIARSFIKNEKEKLWNYCFVFPNRRSGVFFKKALSEETNTALLYPQITTIGDFVAELSGLTETNRMELLILIYEEYVKIAEDQGRVPDDFDKYLTWGDALINDFNDIDKYLVNAEELFNIVADTKNLNTEYLTEDQKTVLKILGANVFENKDDDCLFKNIKSEYVKLWEILYPLYSACHEKGLKSGKTYSGHLYLLASEKIKKMSKLKYDKYIFIGFNLISKAESDIFKEIQKKGMGDFYWDTRSPYLTNGENIGFRYIKDYVKQFPSAYPIPDDNTQQRQKPQQKVNIVAVPSKIGQAKYAASLIEDLHLSDANAVNTAIIIPDENLFLPILSSLSVKNKLAINITMGYPLKFTSISTLINTLGVLQSNIREDNDGQSFFYEDVVSLFAHPLIKLLKLDSVYKYSEKITRDHLFRININNLMEEVPELKLIFKALGKDCDRDDVFEYINSVIKTFESLLFDSENRIEKGFIAQYKASLKQLQSIILAHSEIDLKGKTFFYLIERMLSSNTVQFEGEPLQGIQIMGLLESQCLDFENIILLSMNERIFPKKHVTKSFIFPVVRSFYNLPTSVHYDSLYAYYFYRLLTTPTNSYLIYDSRTQGVNIGEPSRYIYQLKYIYSQLKTDNKHDFDIAFKSLIFNIKPSTVVSFSIDKNDTILSKLAKYKEKDSGEYLSASSIYKYIQCPLSFYLDKIEHIKLEEEVTEFIDSATFGTIVHDVMKTLYFDNGKEQSLTSENIKYKKLKDLDGIIVRNINKTYLKRSGSSINTKLEGASNIIFRIVKYYVTETLDYDSKLHDLKILQCEVRESGYWEDLGINFVQYIDRVDEISLGNGKKRRIVDYKTGGDNVSLNLDKLFSDSNNNKGIFQLFLYCNYYALCHDFDEDIQPVIYKLKEIKSKPDFCLKVGKEIVLSYKQYNDDFMEKLKDKINELFNPDIPFTQTNNINNCTMCNFKSICRR